MERNETAALIRGGEAVFGLELGSTRIKAVLIGPHGEVLASGSYDWENRLEQGVWTYHMDDVWHGIICQKLMRQSTKSQKAGRQPVWAK